MDKKKARKTPERATHARRKLAQAPGVAKPPATTQAPSTDLARASDAAFGAGVGGVVSATAEQLMPHAGPGGTALVAFLGWSLATVVGGHIPALKASAAFYWMCLGDLFKRPHETREQGERRLASHAKDANATRAIFETIRNLLDAATPEIAESLSRLAAEYVKSKEPVDGYFRGVCAVLREVTAAEFRELISVVAALQTVVSPSAQGIYISVRPDEPTRFHALAGGHQQTDAPPPGQVLESFPHFPRVLFLLRAHGLADDLPGTGALYDGKTNRPWHLRAFLENDVVTRLSRVLA